VTAATYFEGRRHRFVVEPPLDTTRHGRLRDDVERVTAAVAERMEQSIRSAPEQWHLLQPNWPSDR
jgi:KDO2-lipid IV(A) lauroyltransferase